MKISELSAAADVPIATLKYYLREQLLPAGKATKVNQAEYDESHLRRVQLIRALVEVGNLPVVTVREVLGAIDNTELPLTWVFGVAQHAVSDAGLYAPIRGETAGTEAVREAIDRLGWHVSPENPGVQGAARVLDTYRRIGHPELAQIWDDYAAGAELIARADLATVAARDTLPDMAETVVVGTVLGDSLVSSLRRMAQEHVSNQQFPANRSPE